MLFFPALTDPLIGVNETINGQCRERCFMNDAFSGSGTYRDRWINGDNKRKQIMKGGIRHRRVVFPEVAPGMAIACSALLYSTSITLGRYLTLGQLTATRASRRRGGKKQSYLHRTKLLLLLRIETRCDRVEARLQSEGKRSGRDGTNDDGFPIESIFLPRLLRGKSETARLFILIRR